MRGAFLPTSPYTKPAMDGGWRRMRVPGTPLQMDPSMPAPAAPAGKGKIPGGRHPGGDDQTGSSHERKDNDQTAKGFHAGPAG